MTPDTASLSSAGDSTIDVNVSLAESYMRSLRPSAGWATLDCFRTQVDYSDFGFLGALRRLDMSARASKIGVGYPTELAGAIKQLCSASARNDTYSDTLNYYVGATLRQSSLFGLRAVPTITLYSELRSEYKVFRRYTPIGTVLSLNQQLRRHARRDIRVSARVRTNERGASDFLRGHRHLRCERAGLSEAVAASRDGERHVRPRSAERRVLSDGRLDSMSLELAHASELIGSDPDLQFNKIVADASWYWALPQELGARGAASRLAWSFGQRITLGSPRRCSFRNRSGCMRAARTRFAATGRTSLGPVVYLPDTLKVCIAPTGDCVNHRRRRWTRCTSRPSRRHSAHAAGRR